MRTSYAVLITSILIAGASLYAQQEEAEADPPSRAARLSYLSGGVSFQPGSVEEWVDATLNRPLTTGDRLWTEAGGRAELHLGTAAFRLDERTNFTFSSLTDRLVQAQVSAGTVSIRLRSLAEDEAFEIDTPQLAFTLLQPGEYRVDVDDQGNATIVTVRGGAAEMLAGGQTVSVRSREQVRVTGIEQPVLDRRGVPSGDRFDNWCMERDRREDRSQSARYVSRSVPGYSDLDDYGEWRNEAEYGAVWVPTRVDPGWAPYHDGHWAWIPPWGWTWVDDAPWGFAPFHYGRWAFFAGVWGWVPGPVVVGVRPVYAPALVAWVGGARFGVGIAVGGGARPVGWFPLAPGEVWVPGYHPSARYFNQVNVSNTVVNRQVNITNVYNTTYVTREGSRQRYVNQGVNGAVTAVPQSAMVSGRRVSDHAVRLSPEALAGAQADRGVAPAAPERGAMLGGRQESRVGPPAPLIGRRVVTRNAPDSSGVRPVYRTPVQQTDQVGAPQPRDMRREPPVSSPAPRGFGRETRVPDSTPAPRIERSNPPPAVVQQPAPAPRVEREIRREPRPADQAPAVTPVPRGEPQTSQPREMKRESRPRDERPRREPEKKEEKKQ